MRLFPRDTDRVMRALPELYAYGPPGDFLRRTLYLLHELIDCDHIGWTVLDCRDTLQVTKIVTQPHVARLFSSFASVLQDSVISHPYAAYFRPDRLPQAIKLSDLPREPLLAYRNRYSQIFRTLELNYQLTLPLVSPEGSIAAVSLDRRLRDFTERDRSVLNALLPHMRRAYANAQSIKRGDDPGQLRRACEEGLGLTGREAEIAFWIAQGKTNLEVAIILGSAPRTVEKHVERVLEKIGVENRVAAAIELHNLSRAQSAVRLATPPSHSYYAGSILIEAA